MGINNNGLEESDMRYFNLLNNISNVIIELNLNLRINYINPQVYEIFGYSPEEVIGINPFEFIHPEDLLCTKDVLEMRIKGTKNNS